MCTLIASCLKSGRSVLPVVELVCPLLLSQPLECDIQWRGRDECIVLNLLPVFQRHNLLVLVQLGHLEIRSVFLHRKIGKSCPLSRCYELYSSSGLPSVERRAVGKLLITHTIFQGVNNGRGRSSAWRWLEASASSSAEVRVE